MFAVIEGPTKVDAFRMRVLYRGLKLETNTGMRMTRGRTCYAIVKDAFGLKGSKATVLATFGLMLAVDAWFTGVEFNP